MKLWRGMLTVLVVWLGSLSFVDANDLHVVAYSGQAASGEDVGVYIDRLSIPVINNQGQILFSGNVVGDDVSEVDAGRLWHGDETGLSIAVRGGDQPPGVEGIAGFYDFISYNLNDQNQVSFNATLSGIGVSHLNDSGIWSNGEGVGYKLLVREGDVAPGVNDSRTFWRINSPLLNNNGQTAFSATLSDVGSTSTNISGFWRGRTESSLALLALHGGAAPDVGEDVNFGIFMSGLNLNDFGQSSFYSGLSGVGVSALNAGGIWSEGGGSGLSLLVQAGDTAAGAGDGVVFTTFLSSFPAFNNNGDSAFESLISDPNAGTFNQWGLWSARKGNGLALVARTGDYAFGTEVDTTFRNFNSTALNAHGQLVFNAHLEGAGVNSSNSEGIWCEKGDGSLRLVARTGDQAPGTSVVFGGSQALGTRVINRNGQIAFSSELVEVGGGTFDSEGTGIWAEDISGKLHLIVRTGETIDVDEGPGIDLRTIEHLRFWGGSGNEDGKRSGFNDLGQVAFWATFTDRSTGVFISNLVAIPEPSTLVMCLIAGCVLGRRNRVLFC